MPGTSQTIAACVHLLVHLARREGHRHVAEVVTLRGYDAPTDTYQLESVTDGAEA